MTFCSLTSQRLTQHCRRGKKSWKLEVVVVNNIVMDALFARPRQLFTEVALKLVIETGAGATFNKRRSPAFKQQHHWCGRREKEREERKRAYGAGYVERT